MADDFSYYKTDGKCYESIYANTNDTSLNDYLDKHFYSKKTFQLDRMDHLKHVNNLRRKTTKNIF